MVFINILLFVLGWVAGTYILSYMVTKFAAKLTAAGIYLVAGAAVAGLLALWNALAGLFLGGGLLVALFLVANPFDLTQEKADEIGKKAAREQAIKEQMEEQQREKEKEMKENERIYKEALNENKKKQS